MAPMKRTSPLLTLALAATLVLAGCGKSHKTVTQLSPSQLFQQEQQQLCGVESKVLGVVNDVASGTVSSQADVSTKLTDLKSQLDDASHSFQKHSFNDLASKVGDLSSAVAKLQTAVTGSDTAGIVAAAAAAASAVAALPGCPGVTPSA